MDYYEIPISDELDTCYRGNILQDSKIKNKEKQLDTLLTVIYDNPFYFDKSYDNPLFVPTIDMHDNEQICLENLYDNGLDDGPMLLDDINYNNTENRIGEVLTLAIRSPIPFESDQSCCYTIVGRGHDFKY